MLVRETPDSFILVNQHNHGLAAGTLAENWKLAYFKGNVLREKVILAVQQHDRGWINLDQTPLWNDKSNAPYSFIDLPTAPKLAHYKLGIDEVAEQDAYAALLCSLHYTSFIQATEGETSKRFLSFETQRQQQLKTHLAITTPDQEELLNYHLQLLKFCDNLSIYFCLNEPGVKKEAEHPWFKNGIAGSGYFGFSQGKLIQTNWETSERARISPFPFQKKFTFSVRYKTLAKNCIKAQSLAECFQNSPEGKLSVLITS